MKCKSFLPEDDPDFVSEEYCDTNQKSIANRRKKGLDEGVKENSSYVSPIGVMLDNCKYATRVHLTCF